MPVLALGGDKAGGLDPLKTMQKVSDNVTGGELFNCGHYSIEECPQEFLAHLEPFLAHS